MKDIQLPPISTTLPDFDKDCEKYSYIQAEFRQISHFAYYANPERYQNDSEQNSVFSSYKSATDLPYNAKPIFENLWYEGELACLFGDTNIGKSALAYQIACKVAREQQQRVAYFNLDNTYHQLYSRYYDMQKGKPLLDDMNLFLFSIAPENVFPPRNIKELLNGIECKFVKYKIPFVIIDDIYHLCSMFDCPATDLVLRTMRHWTQYYKVSILVIAHARRHHNNTPIELHHLCGSQRLPYAFDSIFAINRTLLSNNTLYIKHIKSRNSVIKYDDKHVMLLQLEKNSPDQPLAFTIINNPTITDERILLNICNPETTNQVRQKALELANLGWSLREIAGYFGISHTAVRRLIKTTETPANVNECKLLEHP